MAKKDADTKTSNKPKTVTKKTTKKKASKKKSSKKKAAPVKTTTRKTTKKVAKKKSSKKKSAASTSKNKTTKATLPAEEKRMMIALHAYYKWEAAGRPTDTDTDHWLEAEREIEAMLKP